MEKDEIEKLETIKRLTSNCLSTLRPDANKSGIHTPEIKVYDYYDLASVIRNLMMYSFVTRKM